MNVALAAHDGSSFRTAFANAIPPPFTFDAASDFQLLLVDLNPRLCKVLLSYFSEIPGFEKRVRVIHSRFENIKEYDCIVSNVWLQFAVWFNFLLAWLCM